MSPFNSWFSERWQYILSKVCINIQKGGYRVQLSDSVPCYVCDPVPIVFFPEVSRLHSFEPMCFVFSLSYLGFGMNGILTSGA